MSDRLRVLVVEPYAELGGAEEWLVRLLDATDALQVRALLLKEGPFRAELERRGIPVELHAMGRNPWDVPAPILWLARRLRADLSGGRQFGRFIRERRATRAPSRAVDSTLPVAQHSPPSPRARRGRPPHAPRPSPRE